MIKTSILALFSLLFMIFHAGLVTKGAAAGLLLWYSAVVPALFPFMVLSSILSASGGISWLMQPFTVVFRFCGLSADGWYVLLTGLLCGCPMGAKTCADFLAERRLSSSGQSFSSPSAITRVRCFSQVSSIPCLPLSCRFFALSLPFTRRSCCLLSRHTSFIERLLILNPSRKISVFSNNVQRWISPVRFFQNPHDPINRPVLYFPWMPLS